MDFVFGTMIFIPFLGIVLSSLIASINSHLGYYDRRTGSSHDRKKFWHHFLVSQLILVAVGNLFFLGFSALITQRDVATVSVDANVCDAMGQMGLESTRTYPVEVGARMGGTYGNGYFWSGLFTSEGKLSMAPGSALSVGFDYQGKSAILELPVKRITFVKDAVDTKPTVAIKLKCKKLVDATQIVHYGPLHLRLDSGVLLMARDEIGREGLMISKSVTADGLAPLVAANLKSVEIHLSPELYSKILG